MERKKNLKTTNLQIDTELQIHQPKYSYHFFNSRKRHSNVQKKETHLCIELN